MDLKVLEPHEVGALIGLLQRLVIVDRYVSAVERDHVSNLSRQFDPDVYRQGLEIAGQTMRETDGLMMLIVGVTRQDARDLIYDELVEAAGSDGFDPKELNLLEQIGDAWDIVSS